MPKTRYIQKKKKIIIKKGGKKKKKNQIIKLQTNFPSYIYQPTNKEKNTPIGLKTREVALLEFETCYSDN